VKHLEEWWGPKYILLYS